MEATNGVIPCFPVFECKFEQATNLSIFACSVGQLEDGNVAQAPMSQQTSLTTYKVLNSVPVLLFYSEQASVKVRKTAVKINHVGLPYSADRYLLIRAL